MNTRSMDRWRHKGLGRVAGRFVAAAMVASLAACASSSVPAVSPVEGVGVTPYGQFLAGRAALNDGRNVEASRYYGAVGRLDPEAAAISDERAFVATLLAGDVTSAAKLAPVSEGVSPSNMALGRIVRAVEGMATGRARSVRDLLAPDTVVFPHRSAAALLAPWAAAMSGDLEGQAVRPQSPGDRIVDVFGLLGQARLFEHQNRFDEAETNFKVLSGGDSPSLTSVLAYGGFLERRKRGPEAIALYDRLLATDPRNGALTAARSRAAAGRAEPLPTLRQGASQSLTPLAAALVVAGQDQLGMAYLRLTLRLDPENYGAWLLVGDRLEAVGLIDDARVAYARVPTGVPEHATAQAKLAWSHQRAGEPETALRLARQAAAGGDLEAVVNLSDLNPDEPELLNYLGYSWIDRGENLEKALELVRRAVSQNPRSGAMVDSLGWAYFRLGDYPRAVETLEQAVELQPGDPELNNHLGDAYWRVGRRDEAGFQWKRVLTLEPEAKIRAEVERKLTQGLGPAPVPPARKP